MVWLVQIGCFGVMHTRRCRSYSRSTLLATRTSISRSRAIGTRKIEDGFRRLYTRVPTILVLEYVMSASVCVAGYVMYSYEYSTYVATYINYTSRYAMFQTVAARDLDKIKFDANVEARRPGIDTNVINYARMKRGHLLVRLKHLCVGTSIRVQVYTCIHIRIREYTSAYP